MKKLFLLLVGCLLIVLILIVLKNAVAKTAVENGVRFAIGLPLKIRQFDFSLTQSYIGIEDLQLFNPRGYLDPVMADVPEIYVNYELAPLFRKQIHLEEIRLHLKEFVVVRNEKGELNVDALRPVESQKTPEKPRAEEKSRSQRAPHLWIDSVTLRIEKVVFKDYSKGGAPTVRQFKVNINERYQHVQNLKAVVSLILIKVMISTPLAQLTHFDVSGLQGTVSDAWATSRKVATRVATKAVDATEERTRETTTLMAKAPENMVGVAAAVEDKTKTLAEDFKGVAGSLKKKIPNPFSKEE